jgi:hypothetical protein
MTNLPKIQLSEADARRILGERYAAVLTLAEAWARTSRRPSFR